MHFSPSNIFVKNIKHAKRVLEKLRVGPEPVGPRQHGTVAHHFTVAQARALIGRRKPVIVVVGGRALQFFVSNLLVLCWWATAVVTEDSSGHGDKVGA